MVKLNIRRMLKLLRLMTILAASFSLDNDIIDPVRLPSKIDSVNSHATRVFTPAAVMKYVKHLKKC